MSYDENGSTNAAHNSTTPKKSGLPVWAAGALLLFIAPAVLTFVVWLVGVPCAHLFHAGNAHIWTRNVWYGFVRRDFFPHGFNVLHATGWFWVLFMLWMIAIAAFTRMTEIKKKDYMDRETTETRYLATKNMTSGFRRFMATVSVILVFGSIVAIVYSTRNNRMARAAYYDRSVEFVVANPQGTMPTALNELLLDSGTHPNSDGDCAYLRTGDVPACITQGELPDTWVPRNASAKAASIMLEKASKGASNTTVLDDSLTYLYENDGEWTAIRDGKNAQPTDRIEVWDGKNNVTSCTFSGPYAIKGAFGGSWSNNLKSTVAKAYPSLFSDMKDAWGYCNGDEPIVVLPVTEQIGYGNRTVMTDGGALTIRGNHGGISITWIQHPTYGTDLSKGELPGPSYPLTLVRAARTSANWSAGRKSHNRDGFGFEPTNDAAQYGNVSEYLLKNAQTGELDWVTPLTPRSSDSQQFSAWSVTPAGYSNAGELNQTKIYVMDDNDPRQVNIQKMKSNANNALSQLNPGFFSTNAGGEIVEFLPINATTWQAYGELKGQVIYRIDVPINVNVMPTVYSLQTDPSATPSGTPGSGGATTTPATGGCGAAPGTMTTAQLQVCINAELAELAKRANKAPTPTPSGSPGTNK